MSTTSLLEIKNLRTEFRTENETVTAVNGISFSLNKGETIGIVGESGSGKSVTSLSLMRLIASPPGKIAGGEMLFNSTTQGKVDLATLPEKQLRKLRGNEIAMIFQEPMTSLNPVYTCGNQVMESLLLHKNLSRSAAKARTIELFKEVQLPRPEQLFDSYPHQLSGGQKQRVMIAMAISCNPALLIADEPTTALDVTVQKSILELLQSLQQRYQMGILFITHDLGVVAELADKVIVMYRGNIVEQGAVNDIFTKPQHPYTKGLLACRPPMHVRLKRLPVVSDFMITDNSGLLVENKATVTDITQQLVITADERATRLSNLYAQAPLLQLKNLKTYFPISKGLFGKVTDYVKAVDAITFDVYPGETLGLVGESGCGKTTLGRSILRLVEPTSGEILYKGVNIRNLSYEEMRKMRKEMQLIFQDPYSSLNPRITIGKAIMEPMQVHKVLANDHDRKNKVIELLERVSMSEKHFNRYPHEFSGGQRQRICIARALALSPKFIICDESVSALDVSVQAQVLNLLNELRAEFGFTYIFISHDLSVVKFMSDRMIVMNKGIIEEMGDADAIYNHPQSEYTKKLISAIPKGVSSIKTVVS
ncbi:MAG TPA: ABC transporter ATP-binding protein [Bacteroidia bacterium]|nr:ABC transporter ATP-binding protein [Bacteroidia bacterium]HRH07117.1 ABC transporter ATP-binding protein [Bacteroidia bacterium]